MVQIPYKKWQRWQKTHGKKDGPEWPVNLDKVIYLVHLQ